MRILTGSPRHWGRRRNRSRRRSRRGWRRSTPTTRAGRSTCARSVCRCVGSVTVHDLTFASSKRGRVPAYSCFHRGKGLSRRSSWSRWSNGNRDFVVEDLVDLAKRGVAGMAITPPHMRRDGPLPFTCVARKDNATSSTTSSRYGARSTCSPRAPRSTQRASPIRASVSACRSAPSAVDDRVRAAVLPCCSPAPDAGAYAPLLCWRLSKTKQAAYVRGMADLDVARYVAPMRPTPLLIQNGRRDPIGQAGDYSPAARGFQPAEDRAVVPERPRAQCWARTACDDWPVARLRRESLHQRLRARFVRRSIDRYAVGCGGVPEVRAWSSDGSTRDDARDRVREPPVPASEQRHCAREHQRADDRDVDQDRDGEPESELPQVDERAGWRARGRPRGT